MKKEVKKDFPNPCADCPIRTLPRKTRLQECAQRAQEGACLATIVQQKNGQIRARTSCF